jgi:predicted ABC-type transport system involved in lysophospholipase L1 biosynthesis ATPase subunit
MKNTSQSVQEAVALRRMSLVQAVIELLQRHWPLSAALEQVASTQALPGEGETPPQLVAKRTLEDWTLSNRMLHATQQPQPATLTI